MKIPLEIAQMLSTAHHVLDGDDSKTNSILEFIYRPTHKNHPISIWVRESIFHYQWTCEMLDALLNEYTFRYQKIHKIYQSGLSTILKMNPPVNIDQSLTEKSPFPLCMPEKCKNENDVVESYRKYYIQEKSKLFSWKNRPVPFWIP